MYTSGSTSAEIDLRYVYCFDSDVDRTRVSLGAGVQTAVFFQKQSLESSVSADYFSVPRPRQRWVTRRQRWVVRRLRWVFNTRRQRWMFRRLRWVFKSRRAETSRT